MYKKEKNLIRFNDLVQFLKNKITIRKEPSV